MSSKSTATSENALTPEEIDTEPVMAEGRTIVTIIPKTWHTWDYNKVG